MTNFFIPPTETTKIKEEIKKENNLNLTDREKKLLKLKAILANRDVGSFVKKPAKHSSPRQESTEEEYSSYSEVPKKHVPKKKSRKSNNKYKTALKRDKTKIKNKKKMMKKETNRSKRDIDKLSDETDEKSFDENNKKPSNEKKKKLYKHSKNKNKISPTVNRIKYKQKHAEKDIHKENQKNMQQREHTRKRRTKKSMEEPKHTSRFIVNILEDEEFQRRKNTVMTPSYYQKCKERAQLRITPPIHGIKIFETPSFENIDKKSRFIVCPSVRQKPKVIKRKSNSNKCSLSNKKTANKEVENIEKKSRFVVLVQGDEEKKSKKKLKKKRKYKKCYLRYDTPSSYSSYDE